MRASKEEGSALILALLVSLLLFGLGLTVMWMSSSANSMAGNITRRQEAMKAAEVGIERARSILARTNDWNTLLGTAAGVPCTSTVYQPSVGNVLCDGAQPVEQAQVVAATSTTGTTVPGVSNLRYTVHIRNDPTEVAAGQTFVDTDHQVVLVAEGLARDALSSVALEVWVMLAQ